MGCGQEYVPDPRPFGEITRELWADRDGGSVYVTEPPSS
jgi:hypothetical protein